MLGSLGVTLAIWIGKQSPTSAPYALMNAIRRVTVTASDDRKDGFQLLFSVGQGKGRDVDLLAVKQLALQSRVIIGVYLGATLYILSDGIITHQQLAPSPHPGSSTMTMTGKGLHYKMGLQDRSRTHSGKSDSQIVTDILNSYQDLDLRVLDISDTKTTRSDGNRGRWQHQTDLQFMQKLAADNGYVFYVESTGLQQNRAYFGLPERTPIKQPLVMNMGASTNVTSLDFVQDSDGPIAITGAFFDRDQNQIITIPPLGPSQAPLSGQPLQPVRLVIRRDLAGLDHASARARIQADTDNAPDAVHGEGEVDVVRYGSVLRPRRLIKLCGAGTSFDGNYYISSVTHTLERKKYQQRFSIKRDGTKPA